MRRLIAAGVALIAAILLPAHVWAQSTSSERRWQVDVVGGLSLFDLPTSGTAAIPPPGPPLTTNGPTNPSRSVPTWFLNDGASLLNGTNADFGVGGRLPALDNALGQLGLTGSNAPLGGVRALRHSGRWAIELSAELHQGSVDLDPVLLDAVEAARSGFEAAFTGLFTTGPFVETSVTARSSVSGASSRELALTGAVRFTLRPGRFSPYVTAGGGFIQRLGDLPRIALEGDYQFVAVREDGARFPFSEADSLTIRFDQTTGLIGLAGLGVESRVSERVGFVLDGRAYIGPSTLELRLDSAPSVTETTPGHFIESGTTPAVQFSTNPATGRSSTLSGAPLNGFEAFSTSGIRVRYVMTAGLSIRF